MKSPTLGELSLEQIADSIVDYINEHKKFQKGFIIQIGTDSQNFDDTKIVSVIAIQDAGNGGIYFYSIKRVRKITNIYEKLYTETGLSVDLANSLIKAFEDRGYTDGIMINSRIKLVDQDVTMSVHVDAGKYGPTRELIPGLVQYVTMSGFNAKVKPDSFAAQSIANKYSK